MSAVLVGTFVVYLGFCLAIKAGVGLDAWDAMLTTVTAVWGIKVDTISILFSILYGLFRDLHFSSYPLQIMMAVFSYLLIVQVHKKSPGRALPSAYGTVICMLILVPR
ncbi:MAG TPA: hypothetical protein DDW65_17395 [Firmicutes bacterium]|jgi:uncharacterized membrane protein YczE|nr:hypothetical protein [Bacillota bacterium]